MNEPLDFIKMIDDRLDSIWKQPHMWGTPRELELLVHTLAGLRAEVLGKGNETFRIKRELFCAQHNLRSKLTFADQCVDGITGKVDDDKHLDILKQFVTYSNS